jgi:hypothetical protein
MNEYGATNLQIEQEWIQTKDMFLLCQDQVVSNDVYIGVEPTKPRKLITQSSMVAIPFLKTTNLFRVFTLQDFSVGYC